MLAIEFSIYHNRCPASQSTETFPEVSMRILSSTPHGENKASVLQHASALRRGDLRNFLDYWRNHEAVKDFGLIDRTSLGVIFSVNLRSNIGWVTKAILDNNAFFSTSIPVANGIERWRVFLEDENKTSLFSQLDRVGVVKIDSIRRLEFKEDGSLLGIGLAYSLTPRQLWVLRVAVESGYFDSPRRVESRDLAAKLGIAQSTFLEHLRKGQMNLLREVLGGKNPNNSSA